MKVVIGGKSVRLAEKDLLGAGGEARVYRAGDRAVKIFHPIDASLPDAARLRELRLQKQAKVQRFPKNLPHEVVAPAEEVSATDGSFAGYTMRAVDDAAPLLRLAQRKWREGVVSNTTVTSLFSTLRRVVFELHARDVVVGDFNDGNVLFHDDALWLIDCDSMQFAGIPCAVGHERFLDPRLFGVDLAAAPAFDEGSDWFAYATLLFASLLYVHPYGGLHDKLGTPLRRAEAHHSVLRSDVVYPRAGVHWKVLPDDLLAWLEAVFDKDARAPIPEALLGVMWTKCACGLEHARAACPDCASVGRAAAREAVRHHGRCVARTVLTTRGRIVAAAMQRGLRYAYEEEGTVRREDGSTVALPEPGARLESRAFAIEGRSTWVLRGGAIERIEDGRPTERARSGTYGPETVLATNTTTAFRTDGEFLVDHASGVRMGKILEGEALLFAGDHLGFGFYRAGLLAFFFLFRPGRPGLSPVAIPFDGSARLVEAWCTTDDAHALVVLVTEKDGKTTHAMHLVSKDGAHLAQASGSPAEHRMLKSVRGKALLGGRVVTATDEGLLALRVDSGRFVEGALFPDTKPFVASDVELFAGPGGSIYVVAAKEILELTLH
ncbi:MAG: hypothetical protein JWM74_823 [Myxococcaceae bacterium]|nr:hypothetical protein [Myxococcaceae bacterium]